MNAFQKAMISLEWYIVDMETQADRDSELENCITQEDLDIILEFYDDLTENIKKLKTLLINSGKNM